MKHSMKRKDLMTKDDIWNAIFSVISDFDFPSENNTVNELFIVTQYYSELESGGHESLLTWFSDHIEEVGITSFLQELESALEKIGAKEYAKIESNYGEKMWSLFQSLENGEIEEDDFYNVIELADNAYYEQNGKLEQFMETYFVNVYTEIIEVVD